MTRKKAIKKEKISIWREKAEGCRTDHQKIEFFDLSEDKF